MAVVYTEKQEGEKPKNTNKNPKVRTDLVFYSWGAV